MNAKYAHLEQDSFKTNKPLMSSVYPTYNGTSKFEYIYTVNQVKSYLISDGERERAPEQAHGK